MAQQLDRSTVTFRRDGEPVGVGFVVDRQRVLTCAHVVNEALGRPRLDQDQPSGTVLVEFTPDVVRKARIAVWVPPPGGARHNGEFDIAGLVLTEPLPRAARPLPFGTPKPHARVDMFGYPEDPAKRQYGAWGSGHLMYAVDNGYLQIDPDRSSLFHAQPGYSGSPVVAEKRVVGMLVTASVLPGPHDCYAIPPEWLRRAWPAAIPEDSGDPPRESWWRTLLRKLLRSRAARIAAVLVVVLALLAFGISKLVGAPAAREDCVPLHLSVSTEKDELLKEIAATYNASGRTFGNDLCAKVEATGFTSGTAMEAIAAGWPAEVVKGRPAPQVWLPSTSMWADLLRQKGRGALLASGDHQPVTSSVLVIAMPERMAKAVREERADPGWKDVLDLATNADGWAEVGHEEWGPFVLGRDNPNFSSSGLAASVATYFAAAGKRDGFTSTDLANGNITEYVRKIDLSVLRYGNEATEFMRSLYDEDRHGDEDVPYVSAVLMQEQLVYLYNKGAPLGDLADRGPAPRERMVAVHPSEGTVEFDHPYLTLSSATPEQRMAAQDFYEYLVEDEQQQKFTDYGFRALTDRSRPTPQLAETVGGSTRDRQRFIELPEPAMLAAIQDAWDGTRKAARVLLVLDVSGSMNDPADNKIATLGSKLDVLKPAAKRALALLGNRDQVGIWVFNQTSTQVLPISDVPGVRSRLDGIVDGLVAQGDTALYATTLAAKNALASQIDDARINAIVLLSDGKNQPPDAAARAALLEQIAPENQETSVRIFTVPYGADADSELLGKIADVTNARYYNAAIDPVNIDEVMVAVFSNFS